MSDFFSGSRHQVDVIAHRGGKGEAPEETLFAFANAKTLGVDVLEMDIRVTRDGELVLMHNPTVRATTNGWLPVRCYRLAELQKLDAAYRWNPKGLPKPPHRGAGIIVPTFRQVLEQFRDMRLNIEIKGWHPLDAKKIARKFCDLLVEFGMTRRVLVASFHSPVLRVIRRELPEVAISASTFEVIRFVVSSRWGTGNYRPNVAAIQTSNRSINRRVVIAARKHGLELHGFTVNEVEDMQRLIELGVDGIVTDFPTRLLDLLKRLDNPQDPTTEVTMTQKAAQKHYCDVVMKGGITSGVVYPLAITELAQKYEFRNIGGTSAGAIAAAAAAAAEYRRQANGSSDGFEKVGRLPDELAGGALERLFQPQFSTRSLFKLGLTFVGSSHWSLRFGKALVKLFVLFPLGTLIGALPGLVILYYLRRDVDTPWSLCLWVGVVFLLVVLPSFLMALVNVVVQALWAIPANNYGLCGGSGGNGKNKPLTDWMTEKLEFIAQKNDAKTPLIFNDLWTAGKSKSAGETGADREINLEMMTTNLTLGRPHRIPLEDEKLFYYFRESEFRNLFPRHIVDYMIQAKPGDRGDAENRKEMLSKGFHPLPDPDALPVVVAARMSLSFPILISTIPLYTFDPSITDPKKRVERYLFSDGGISSNFPIHFFDAPLPRWPTFGITLSSASGTPEERDDDSTRVSLSRCNQPSQTEEDFNRFDEKRWRLGGFVGSILNTLRNWRDQTQARVPGYRDRIATIHLSRSEGGLNLNMPPETIKKLSGFGASAGRQLRRRFNPKEGDGSGLNWENQRWIRYRSFISVFEQMLTRLKRGFEFPSPDVPSYQEMIESGGVAEAPHPVCRPGDKSPLTEGQKQAAKERTAALLNLARLSVGVTFEEGAPEPPPALVIRPKV